MSHSLKLRHALMVAAVGVLLTFQNCAQVGQESTEAASSFESGLPFAYDSKIDTIAYMSCSNIKTPTIEKRAYFSIRAGSYAHDGAGVKMTPEFREATKFYTPTERARMFAMSDLNSSTRLSLAVRPASSLQQTWTETSAPADYGISSFLPQLDSAVIAGPLAAAPDTKRLRYFPGNHTQRLMEASLRLWGSEKDIAQVARYKFNQREFMLVMGYANSSDALDKSLRGPAGDMPSAKTLGTGFNLTFGLPQGYTNGMPDRVLTGPINEVNLVTGEVTTPFDCNQSYHFLIVRPKDIAAEIAAGRPALCRTGPDYAADDDQRRVLAAIRRVLPVSDWWVDVTPTARCVVPKNPEELCYGQGSDAVAISYRTPTCATTGTAICPHFVSVCIRR